MHNLDTLFLDRDGVINKKLEGSYVRNFSEFEFMPGALDAISKLSKKFKRIIIVTNQQGISKGLMSENDLDSLHSKMEESIRNAGGSLAKIYYCPHLDELNCRCRKPQPGMIEQAIRDFPNIRLEFSYLIGDSKSDIEAGMAMNLNTIKVNNHYTLAKWTSELLAVM